MLKRSTSIYIIGAYLMSLFSLSAGSFVTDFNSGKPPGAALYGSAFVASSGGSDGKGCLKLTTERPEQSAGFILTDLDTGVAIDSFAASFQLYLAHSGPAAGDGFSFNFADMQGVTVISELGFKKGLTIAFHTFDSGLGAGIFVLWDGVPIKTNRMTLVTGTWVPVSIRLNTNGAVSVTHGNETVFTDVATPFKPMQGQFGLGARSGANRENAWIDALSITTKRPSTAVQKRLAGEAKALAWNQSQAAAGDAFGLFRMGERYRDGDGVAKDLDKAREMFEAAAAKGNSDAIAAIARLPKTQAQPFSANAIAVAKDQDRAVAPDKKCDANWIAHNAKGMLEAFVRGKDNAIWHNWQIADKDGKWKDGKWSGWHSMGGDFVATPAVIRDCKGHLEVFAVDSATSCLFYTCQTPGEGSGWSKWCSFGSISCAGTCAVAQDAHEQLVVFVRGNDNALHYNRQLAEGGWNGWTSMGGNFCGNPAVARDACAGLLHVFAVDSATKHLWHACQTPGQGSGWSVWDDLGGVGIDFSPAVGVNAKGNLEVFVRSHDGAIYSKCQTGRESWSVWQSLGGDFASGPTVQNTLDGNLEVYAVDKAKHTVRHALQTPEQGAGWTPWSTLSGIGVDGTIGVGRKPDGTEAVFTRGHNGVIYFNYQTPGAGNGWHGWAVLASGRSGDPADRETSFPAPNN